jgi:hypothetical protein
MFTGVMQRMGLERVVRGGGIDLAQVPPLAEPALDDVDVVHPTWPPFCNE